MSVVLLVLGKWNKIENKNNHYEEEEDATRGSKNNIKQS
jgi:hypothetical protein